MTEKVLGTEMYLLLFGMYFLPDLKLRLLVEDVMMSLSCLEGVIMDWLIMLAGPGPGEGARSSVKLRARSPVMLWLILGGSSLTPAMLELSPANENKIN